LSPPEVGGLADAPAGPDLAQVKGMETARRAMEIAAAGGHHLLRIDTVVNVLGLLTHDSHAL
jgi:magnesium chelatase family protein